MTSSEKISKGINLFAQGLGEMLSGFVKSFSDAVNTVLSLINKIEDKKLSKKKFMKLLQSEGIQRNTINKIVANNKDPYTYFRFIKTVDLYEKESE